MTFIPTSTESSRLEEQNYQQLLLLSRRLISEAQAFSSRIASVNEIAIAINQTLKVDEILRVVGKQAKWLLDFEHCSVCLRDKQGTACAKGDKQGTACAKSDRKETWSINTLFSSVAEVECLDISNLGVVSHALRTGQAQLIHDNSTIGFLHQYKSAIVIPLECDRQILGTINFASITPKTYNQEDLRIGYLLAVQLSAAIRNAERFEELNRLYLELEEEKRKSDELLLNILPTDIASELKQTGTVKPVFYESASVLFTDFKNFTQLSEQLTPQELVDELDYCFSCFDQFIEAHNLEKLKTIGDSYMCVGGIPVPNKTHAIDTVLAAINIRAFMQWRKQEKVFLNYPYWDIRIGIHSGPLLAGVIGHKKFAYDVWGDTVNTASRMESSGIPGSINISQNTFELVKDFFAVEYRGKVSAKNKGDIDMYLVTKIKDGLSLDPTGLLPNELFNELYFTLQSSTDPNSEKYPVDTCS